MALSPAEYVFQVASALEESPEVDVIEGLFRREWEHDGLIAGVWASDEGCGVYLAEAHGAAPNVELAVHYLKEIFADRLVALSGFSDGRMEYGVFASANDDGNLVTNTKVEVGGPEIDSTWVRTWSGEGDSAGPPEYPDFTPAEPKPDPRYDIWGRVKPPLKD